VAAAARPTETPIAETTRSALKTVAAKR
jgi:hypothetical protein